MHDGYVPPLVTMARGPRGLAPGFLEPLPQAQPAAGAGFSYVCGNVWWEELVALSFVLTTDAVVATRFVNLQLLDADGHVLAAVGLNSGTVASQTLNVYAYQTAPSAASAVGTSVVPVWQEIPLRPGWQVRVVGSNLDVGDQITNVVLTVRRYPAEWASGQETEDWRRELHEVWQEIAGGRER